MKKVLLLCIFGPLVVQALEETTKWNSGLVTVYGNHVVYQPKKIEKEVACHIPPKTAQEGCACVSGAGVITTAVGLGLSNWPLATLGGIMCAAGIICIEGIRERTFACCD